MWTAKPRSSEQIRKLVHELNKSADMFISDDDVTGGLTMS